MTTVNHFPMVVPSIHVKGSQVDHVGNVKKAFSQAANISYDIEIIASGGERLATNRFILSIFSPFLHSLLKENGGVSTTLYLPDCSFRSLKHLLSLFTGGISLINFLDINDLNETAKLLSVDLKNISFLDKNSFESLDNRDKNETIVTEGFLDRYSELKEAPKSDVKRCGKLSFEKYPSALKQLKIYDRNFMKIEPNSKVCMLYKNENECKNNLELKNLKCENYHIPEKSNQSEDSGYKSDQTSSLITENIFNFPKSPQKKILEKKTLTCTKKGRNNSFCKIHMKVHTVKKVFENNETKLTGKFRRKLLINKDSKYDWKDDVCNISFNTRVKLRDHRREVKCKQRDRYKNKQKSIDLHFLEDQSHDSVKEKKIHLPIFEEGSHFSNGNNMNDYMELDLITSGRNLEISEDISQESFQCGEFTDSSSIFSSLMHNPFISSKEEESPKYSRKLTGNETIQTKGETCKKDSWNSGTPRRLAVSELKSSDLPSTSKDMSPFESRHNTSPTRKELILKCCPESSTLKKCCLKLDK